MPIHCRRFHRAVCLLALLIAIVSAVLPVAAQNTAPLRDDQVVRITGPRTNIEIIEKFVKVVELQNRIIRVDGFDPGIVDVTALSANRIRIQAVAQGVTTVVLTDERDETWAIEAFVIGDARHLQAIISTQFPDSSVKALKVRESVMLQGWVTKPENITQIVEIAEQFFPRVLNQMKVGGVQQVKLQVKVMEVQRGKIRQLGVNFRYLTRNAFLATTPGQIVQLGSAMLPIGGPPAADFTAATLNNASVAFGVVDDNNAFGAFIHALKEESLLKILAEPEVVTTNGRPATVLSGGEFPILVPQSLGTTTIEWRPFGVRLEAVPIILGAGRLRLEVEPEVSERDFTNAVQINSLTVPGLTTRRVNTSVEMSFGQTLMIAGLIANRDTVETQKIPYFGDLPVIGTAFSRKRYSQAETELVIMVTPELVAPMDRDQIPPRGPGQTSDRPSGREFYVDQMIEVPFYGDHCEGCDVPGAGGVIQADGMYAPGMLEGGVPAGPGMHLDLPPNPETGLPIVPPAIDEPPPADGQSAVRRFTDKLPLIGRTTPPQRDQIRPVGFEKPDRRPTNSDAGIPATPPRNSRPGLIEPRSGIIAPQQN